MKNLLFAACTALMFIAIGCNRPIEWNDQMVADFNKKCLEDMATKFKAENPEEFCTCYVNKMKENNMGMMDMLKETVSILEDCGVDVKK